MTVCADPERVATNARYSAAKSGSDALLRRLRYAIDKQAKAWGIRHDQAQALLLDRKAMA